MRLLRCLGLLAMMLIILAPLSVEAAKDWNTIKGRNFFVHYRLDVPESFATTVLEAAEQEFQTVTTNLGITRYQSWAWEKRATIYIYSDQKDYIQNGGMEWSHGAAVVQTKTIKTFP